MYIKLYWNYIKYEYIDKLFYVTIAEKWHFKTNFIVNLTVKIKM